MPLLIGNTTIVELLTATDRPLDKNVLAKMTNVEYDDVGFTYYLLEYGDYLRTINVDGANIVFSKPHGLATGDMCYVHGMGGIVEVEGVQEVTVVNTTTITLVDFPAPDWTSYAGGGTVRKIVHGPLAIEYGSNVTGADEESRAFVSLPHDLPLVDRRKYVHLLVGRDQSTGVTYPWISHHEFIDTALIGVT